MENNNLNNNTDNNIDNSINSSINNNIHSNINNDVANSVDSNINSDMDNSNVDMNNNLKLSGENLNNNKNDEQNKGTKNFSTLETILLVVVALIIGFTIGGLLNKSSIITKESVIKDKYLKEFIENYEFIINNYYEDIDKEKLINDAIAGMTESLDDPYSMYFNENESNNFSITLDGSYKGIGIQISKNEETGYMIIAAVFKNSPASEAGLKAGDEIISIDGTKSSDMSASDFSSLVKDSKKDEHILNILRDGQNLEVKLNKRTVTLNSVASEIYEINNKKIGYIYIGIFASNTYTQFKENLDRLEKENIDSLIIDVRGNTGGHLTAVDKILDIFLNSEQVMYQFNQNDKISKTYGTGKDNKKYEITLLCDESSASASEVLIAGLKDNLNSTVIGKKTYGKGTVQEMVTLSNGTQYKITVKKWLTPKGNWINDTKGITPDIEVDLGEKYYQTLEDEDDLQLQAALNYLKDK